MEKTPEKSAEQGRVRLLEVKNTPPTQAKKKTKDELAQLELKKAIEDKLSFFEGQETEVTAPKAVTSQTPFEDDLASKLTKIY